MVDFLSLPACWIHSAIENDTTVCHHLPGGTRDPDRKALVCTSVSDTELSQYLGRSHQLSFE